MDANAPPITAEKTTRARRADMVYQRFSLKYVLEILFRRKRTLILPTILVSAIASTAAMLMPKTYVSSTSILLGKDEVLNPLVRWQTAVQLSVTDYMLSFDKIVYSRTLLESLIDRLKLLGDDPEPLEVEAELGKLREAIFIGVSGADSFTIGAKWSDPVVAKEIAETTTELFIEKSLEGGRREATTAVDFIQAQLDLYQAQLARAETRLRAYKEEHPERLPDRQLSYLAQLGGFKQKLVDVIMEIETLSLKVQLFEKRLSGEEEMVVQSATFTNASPLNVRAEQLAIEVAEKRARLRPGHPDLVEAEAKYGAVLVLLAEENDNREASETNEVRSPTYQEVVANLQTARVDLEAAIQMKANYEELIAELEVKAAEIPESEMALNALQREVIINQELFQQLREKVEHARVSQQVELASQQNRFNILDAAEVPLRHASPKVPLLIIGGVFGGIFLGLGLILLFEFLDQSVVREEEMVFTFDETILASVPKLHT